MARQNERVGRKISKLVGEGKPQDQAIAIALDEFGLARDKDSGHKSGHNSSHKPQVSHEVDIFKAIR